MRHYTQTYGALAIHGMYPSVKDTSPLSNRIVYGFPRSFCKSTSTTTFLNDAVDIAAAVAVAILRVVVVVVVVVIVVVVSVIAAAAAWCLVLGAVAV